MKDLNITLPLTDFVNSHLGYSTDGSHLWDKRPISESLALIIFNLCKNEHTCYIQFTDDMSPDLTSPILWDISAWRQSSERWYRDKERSENQRTERMIFEANCKLIAKECMREWLLDWDISLTMASRFLRTKNMGALAMLGIKDKLIKTKDEI